MQIRSFQLSDYASVAHLLEEVLSEVCYEETIAAFARQLTCDSELILIAQEDERIAGVIVGTIDDNKAYYYRIAVHQNFRGRGVGKDLIHALKKRFLLRRVSRIFVTVDAHNEPILPLYESAGCLPGDFIRCLPRLRIVNG